MGEFIKDIFEVVGSKNNLAAKIAPALFLFFLLYFTYLGITTTPEQIGETDSLVYHIPLAQSFSEGDFFNLSDISAGLGYYPGIGESILAIFIKLGIPLNLFNVLGLVLLFYASKKTARMFGLNRGSSLIFASAVGLLPTVIRLLPAQTIDIWLAVFFLWSLILLVKPRAENAYFIQLGILFGLLVGVKYSGILYAIALILVFGRRLVPYLSTSRVVLFFMLLSTLGLSWYFRNYFLTGNPFYPVSIFLFPGNEAFIASEWVIANTIFTYSEGLRLMSQAFVSEYLIWSLSPLIVLVLFIFHRGNKEIITKKMKNLVYLGVLNFIIWLPQPSGPGIQLATSNYRFTYPAMIPIMLVVFTLAGKLEKLPIVHLLAILSAISVLPQLSYRPKLVLLWLTTLVLIALVFSKGGRLAKRL